MLQSKRKGRVPLKLSCDSVLFDVDGTLWDTTEVLSAAWNDILHSRGVTDVTITSDDLKNTFGRQIPEIADILLPDISKETRRALIDDCCRLQTPVLQKTPGRLYNGVREMLTALSKDYRLFVVSNCEKGYIETLIETCRLDDLFDDFECYGNTHLPKSGSMRLLMERNGLRAPIYVGDTQGDLAACREIGVPFVFAAYGFGTPQEWEARIEGPRDLLKIVQPK